MNFYIIINKEDKHLYENKLVFGELIIRESDYMPKGMAFICGESFNSEKMILKWTSDKEFEYKKLEGLKYNEPLIVEDPYKEHLENIKFNIMSSCGLPIRRPEFHGLIYNYSDTKSEEIKKEIKEFIISIGKRFIET